MRSHHAPFLAGMFRKDDYAFFLQPVDVSQIPTYQDMIKEPMDLGTITKKVEEGRYRSLDDFTVRMHFCVIVFLFPRTCVVKHANWNISGTASAMNFFVVTTRSSGCERHHLAT